MTEQEKKHLGAWSSKLPSPRFNTFRVCLIGLFKREGLKLSVNALINKAMECVKKKGGDTDEISKVIGLYLGEYVEVQDLEEFQEEKEDMSFKIDLNNAPNNNIGR